MPSLVCPHQDMRMSDFTFETGKMSDEEYQFFHNGPDFTEVIPYFLYSLKGTLRVGPCLSLILSVDSL